MSRTAERHRATKETTIDVSIDLDGSGRTNISTGIPFYDHMLDQLGRHGGFDLTVQAVGDLQIDTHHTSRTSRSRVGEAFAEALGDKAGVRRFASGRYPLDEALVDIALDLSGRPFVEWLVPMPESLPLGIPAFDPQLAEHAVSSFATSAGITLHVELVRGRNVHHIIEATFKGLARSLARRRTHRRCRRRAVDERRAVRGRSGDARPLIAVLDYGIGNLHSAQKALEHGGADARLTADAGPDPRCRRRGAARCRSVRRVHGRAAIGRAGSVRRTTRWRRDGRSSGICVGMQMLFTKSEEDEHGGRPRRHPRHGPMDPGRCPRSRRCSGTVCSIRGDDPMFAGLGDEPYVYFVHSLHGVPDDPDGGGGDRRVRHDAQRRVPRDNVFAAQFHPEKSSAPGLRMLANFVDVCDDCRDPVGT